MIIDCPCPDGKRLVDGVGQFRLVGVVDLPGGPLGYLVGLPKSDPPLQEQPQAGPHGMSASFHDDKVSLRDGLELIRGHKRPLNHLETLAAIVLSPGDGTAHHGAAAQGLGQHLGGLAVGCEAAEDGVLAVIRQNLCPFLAVVLLQLGQALDDGHQGQPPGAASGE